MVGTGVFTTTGLLLESLDSVPAVLLAWGLSGLLAMAGALSYAELVAALPHNGGEYQLLSTIYHPAVGFTAGFVSFIVGFSAPIAASAIAFGTYLHGIWPWIPIAPAAVLLVLSMSSMHAFRVGAGSDTQDALTAFKVLLIVGFIIGGALYIDPARLTYATRPMLDVAVSPAFAAALVFVSFSYSGWNAATYIAGELDDPGRSLPIALIVGTAVVTCLYLGVNVVFLASAPPEALSGHVDVGMIAARHLFGDGAGVGLGLIIAFGLVSTVGALIMTGTRVLDAMGEDHGPLATLARRATRGGPFVAVGLQALVACAMVLTASFDTLLTYIGFTLSVFAALTVGGVLVLRWRQPGLERPYRAFLYPFTPILFILLMAWMILWSIEQTPQAVYAGAATGAVGMALWLLMRALERRRQAP